MIPKMKVPVSPNVPWTSPYRPRKDPPMRDTNPYSDGLRAAREEVIAVSMLLGDEHPIVCSCCLGKGTNSSLFGLRRSRCGQCDGKGYDWIGLKTLHYFTRKRAGNE